MYVVMQYTRKFFDKAVGLLYNRLNQLLLLSIRLRAGHEKKIPGNRFSEDNKGVPLRRLHKKCGRFFVEKEEQIQFFGVHAGKKWFRSAGKRQNEER